MNEGAPMTFADSRHHRHSRALPLVSSLVAALLLLGGCAVYNEECARFMDDPDGVAGYLSGEVSIAREEVRLRDNAIGQLMAEAYYHAFDGVQSAQNQRPQLAIVNGGSIRSDGLCETRTSLPKGEVKRKVLRDILPYDNTVVLTSVTLQELKEIFEHSMATYSIQSPAGAYLQVAGVRVTIDCSQRIGARIQSIELCRVSEANGCDPAAPANPNEIFIALDSYIFGGGDNFRFPAQEPLRSASNYNFEVVAQYFSEAYPKDKPLANTATSRVTLINCGSAE
jgi:2',3'-cyclic-nucleotide 2'-phosphodiesterase (5'-nucleotidase family)